MKLHIKNMVCDRCKLVIRNVLQEQGLKSLAVHLGQVDFGDTTLNAEQLNLFRHKIEALGFELINDKKSKLIEKIKSLVITFVQQQEQLENQKLSDHLSHQLRHDYTYLSNLFSSIEGTTIEQYLINQKIEKAKELLVYNELTLTEISYQLGYSSVAHLSRQFKKVTGLTASQFKQLRNDNQRQSLDKV